MVKAYWTAAFLIGTALTILVNGAHARGIGAAPGSWLAVGAGIVPPAMFAVLVEGYFLVRKRVPLRVQRVVKWSAGGLALAAFAVSYEATHLFLMDTPGGFPEWVSWTMPAMVDTFVAVSGYVLYVLNANDPTEASTETVTSSWWSRRLGETDAVRAAKTAKKLAQIQAETEAISTATTTTSTDNTQVAPVMEAPQAAVDASTDALVDAQTEPREDSTDTAVEPATASTDAPKPSTKSSTERRRKPTVEAIDPKLEPFMEAARQMQADGIVTRKNEKFFAEIIRAIEVSGASNNSIKTRGLASAAAADTVRQAWKQWKSEHETTELADLERRLVSVS